ncbi:MAG: hypothetical protein ABIJ75_07460 [Actinomycetota bacterium]
MLTERLSDLLDGDRALTFRSRRGRALLQVGLVPALAVGAAAVLLAPRATAALAVGAMFRGISLTIDRGDPIPAVEAA